MRVWISLRAIQVHTANILVVVVVVSTTGRMGEDVHCYTYCGSVVSWIISFFSVFIIADYLVSMLYIILSSYLFYPCYIRAGTSRG